jgi:hypothetical protein
MYYLGQGQTVLNLAIASASQVESKIGTNVTSVQVRQIANAGNESRTTIVPFIDYFALLAWAQCYDACVPSTSGTEDPGSHPVRIKRF